MRVRQYVYFALRSERISAVQIAREIGLEPDEVKVQGSRLPDVPVPRAHAWQVSCRDTNLFLDEQISRVLDRLEPYADRIGGWRPDSMPTSRASPHVYRSSGSIRLTRPVRTRLSRICSAGRLTAGPWRSLPGRALWWT
ncbi:DUF4279 domain-containing protein [Dactylosporangium sp. CA-233914]|uniref:DUF4279 domain-containing protein n=1 Tax=Dactylosporangium sp. CA-233914 TaxID=3239934 RepID=UPI003D8C2AFC